MRLWCNGKRWGFSFASGFLYLYLYLYKSPCQQVTEMKGIKGECREGWNSPVWGICSCSFLGALWVPCVRVHDRSCSDSVWLFIPWGPGFLCKCKGTFTALPLVSLLVWRLSIVINGHTSSDQSLGPMLIWVCLGDVCVMLGSFLVFLVFCYILIGRMVYHIYFITTGWPCKTVRTSCVLQTWCPLPCNLQLWIQVHITLL